MKYTPADKYFISEYPVESKSTSKVIYTLQLTNTRIFSYFFFFDFSFIGKTKWKGEKVLNLNTVLS